MRWTQCGVCAVVLATLLLSGCSAKDTLPPKPMEKSIAAPGTSATGAGATDTNDEVSIDENILKEKENPTGELTKPGRFAGQRAVKIVDGLVYAFRWAPPGEFWMGRFDHGGYRNSDTLLHPVQLTKGFWMLETELTVDMAEPLLTSEARASIETRLEEGVIGETLSPFTQVMSAPRRKYYERCKENAGCPLVAITFGEAEELCEKLSEKLGATVSMPTEAQWEYACRAGSTDPDGGIDLSRSGWYVDNREYGAAVYCFASMDGVKNSHYGVLHDVGSLAPNAWGLYDMLGNVSEWMLDYYSNDYYYTCYQDGKIAVDPYSKSGRRRAIRGGSNAGDATQCHPAARSEALSGYNRHRGMRVIVVPE